MTEGDLLRTTWLMREDGVRRRNPSWIPRSFWVPLVLLVIPLMIGDFSRELTAALMVATAAHLLYAAFAYVSWRSSHRTDPLERRTVLVVVGYDGILLLFFSLVFLLSSLLALQRLPPVTSQGSMMVLGMYGVPFLVVASRGKAILRYITRRLNRPLAPEMRWLLGVPSAIIGGAVALGAALGGFSVGWGFIAGICAIGALSLAPFAALTLFQIPLFLLAGD